MNKHRRHRQRKITRASLFALLKFLCITFLVIFLFSEYFEFGEQIKPMWVNDVKYSRNPECRLATDFNISVREGTLRFLLRSKSPNGVTYYQSWRLFRFFVRGPFYTEEIRPSEKHDLYSVNDTKRNILAVHYDMTQIGNVSVEAFCLDEKVASGSFESVYNRNLSGRQKSVVFPNLDMENVCRTKDNLVVFTYANVNESQSLINEIPNVLLKEGPISDFSRNLPDVHHLQSCAWIDAYDSSVLNIIHNAFLGPLIASKTKASFGMNVPAELKSLEDIVKKVIGYSLIYCFSYPSRNFCWYEQTLQRSSFPLSRFTSDNIQEMRNRLFGKVSITKKIVTNFVIADFLPNIDVPVESLGFKTILEKIELVKNAQFLILVDDGDAPALATLLQPEAVCIIIPLEYQNSGGPAQYESNAAKIAKKSDCKIEFCRNTELPMVFQKFR